MNGSSVSDLGKDVWMVLPPIHCGFSSFKESSFSNNELSLNELNDGDLPKVGIPHGLISSNRLGKIISWYHIPRNFIC